MSGKLIICVNLLWKVLLLRTICGLPSFLPHFSVSLVFCGANLYLSFVSPSTRTFYVSGITVRCGDRFLVLSSTYLVRVHHLITEVNKLE